MSVSKSLFCTDTGIFKKNNKLGLGNGSKQSKQTRASDKVACDADFKVTAQRVGGRWPAQSFRQYFDADRAIIYVAGL